MNYRGYSIDHVTQITPAGAQPAWAITDAGKVRAYTSSRDFSKHVIDVKIQTGEWPDQQKTKEAPSNG